MRSRWMMMAPVAVVGILLFLAIGGEVVLHLWNWLLPPLFGWQRLTFWQALGLLALCRILFGGLGLHGGGRSRMHHRMRGHCTHTPSEEHEHFHQRLRERFGFGPAPSEGEGG